MSQKIKSKDLSYDSTLPPFLQRLRAQNAGRGDTDRHEFQIARAKKAKVDDGEDEPTIVDESGELLSRDEFKERVAGDAGNPDLNSAEVGALRQPQKSLTDGTAPAKKRKLAKVVGEDPADEQADDEPVSGSKPAKPSKEKSRPSKEKSRPSKKKSKPIKLAFDEDDGS